ncbi:MAG: dockerin type I domain-containing protein, partial [Phycisphaerae bacterium]|nr:dockerin type I domain-containing protein [Phycisphaerae bacterium]
LLNSAHKTAGWDNGQTPFGAGVETTQSLDYHVGAGRLDLDRAYGQYLAGTTDLPGQANGNLGLVQAEGWDFGRVIDGTDNDYYINRQVKEGTTFAATLTWFRDRSASGPTVYDNGQSDLDLIVFDATGGTFAAEVSRSISDYNVVEHLYFTAPLTGYYGIRVRFDGVLFGTRTSEEYGLAWWAGPSIFGDGNGDGKVDSVDLAIWQQNYDPLGENENTFVMGDWNADGFIDSADLALWQQNYDPIGGSVLVTHTPEPATLFVMTAAGLPLLLKRKLKSRAHRGRSVH